MGSSLILICTLECFIFPPFIILLFLKKIAIGANVSCVWALLIMQLSYQKKTKFQKLFEPRHGKTRFLPMRKQRRRSTSQYCEADQCLCFRYLDSFKLLACFCNCIAWFVSDLVGNPVDRFSGVVAHFDNLTVILIHSGASWSKLTMLLVNDLLKFQMAILQIQCYFLLK